jgi:hypothetical protein
MTNNFRALCLLTAGVALAAGCATKKSSREQFVPGSGIAEFRQITETSTQAIQNTLASLEVVAVESNRVSSEALTGLNTQVQRLQVDSIQVRARAQAILARGDAYFDRWHETLAKVKDREVRALAAKRRPLLQESFRQIKRSSEQSQVSFKSFLSGLRGLRNSLENNPGSLDTAAMQEVLGATRANGRQLLQLLSSIRVELDSMQAMLTPQAKATKAL